MISFEPPSTFMLDCFRQVIGALMLLVVPLGAPLLTDDQIKRSSCIVDGDESLKLQDLTLPATVQIAFLAFAVILFVALFETKYNRLIIENEKRANEAEINSVLET